MAARSNIKAKDLSGGERRRLEVMRAMALHPLFMLLDEPFAGVDPLAVDDLQQIIVKLKEKNVGVLITDHNVHETLEITDRAYIILKEYQKELNKMNLREKYFSEKNFTFLRAGKLKERYDSHARECIKRKIILENGK